MEMHLAAFIDGAGGHIAGWRLPEAEVGAVDFAMLDRLTQAAERAKFDMVFLADGLVSTPTSPPESIMALEVLTVLAGLAVTSKRIGLAATASTTYSQPYNLARMLSSIDHMSGGRAGWNVVTTANPNCAYNFGLDEHPPKDERYRRAEEFLEVAKGLWDSWEDGALLQAKESGRFVDLTKRHELNHKGEFYSVKGPLNIARMPQGYPVIIQAGSSDAGLPFAAKAAEVIFGAQDTIESAKAFAQTVKTAAAKFGRDPSHLKILQGVTPLVASSEEEASAIVARLSKATDPVVAASRLSTRLGLDITHLPPDGPVPEIPPEQMRGYAKTLTAAARRHGFNLGQLRDYAAISDGHFFVMGTAEKIANELQQWFEAGAADGFMILPLWHPGPFDRFAAEVVPILQERGLFRRDYSGKTLRDHLGLPRPSGRGAHLAS